MLISKREYGLSAIRASSRRWPLAERGVELPADLALPAHVGILRAGMPPRINIRLNEVSFCADVKSWADALFTTHPEWPFSRATIEEYGTGNYKRQDIRIYREGSNTPVLTGEVK